MKELDSPVMRRFLAKGVTSAKTRNPPGDGYFVNLLHENLRNGWRYQVEYVHDTRLDKLPYVVVYAFKPPNRLWARSADFYLKQSV